MKIKKRKNLEEILQSTSEVLYPVEMGDRPVHIDSRSIEEDTPLHVLAWRDDLYGVKTLIEAGADINATGDMDETALHIALRKENQERKIGGDAGKLCNLLGERDMLPTIRFDPTCKVGSNLCSTIRQLDADRG